MNQFSDRNCESLFLRLLQEWNNVSLSFLYFKWITDSAYLYCINDSMTLWRSYMNVSWDRECCSVLVYEWKTCLSLFARRLITFANQFPICKQLCNLQVALRIFCSISYSNPKYQYQYRNGASQMSDLPSSKYTCLCRFVSNRFAQKWELWI